MKTSFFPLTMILAVFVSCQAILAAGPATGEPRPLKPPTAVKPERPTAEAASLEAFLETAPAIRDRIVWITGDGKHQPFAEWSPTMKERIETFYKKLRTGDHNLGMHLPPASQMTQSGTVYYTVEQAFDLYAAHVAHVVHVEAKHLVPWSIQGRPAVELDELLESSSYVSRIKPSANTYPDGIKAQRDFLNVPENDELGETNSDPRIGYDFLSGKTSTSHKSIIGQTELETLVNLTAWLRDNVTHGPLGADRFKVLPWLDQRLRAYPGQHSAIAIMGCHSSAKLMIDLTRSVNIPLMHARSLDPSLSEAQGNFFNCSHGALIYGWGNPKPRIVWHVDEINASACQRCFPIDERTGELLPQKQADQKYFDELWLTPQELAKLGFTYRLALVIPGKGYGKNTRGQYEDRVDFGRSAGQWKKKGSSNLSELYDILVDHALCAENMLSMYMSNVLDAQLTANFKLWQGDFATSELPPMPSFKELDARAEAAIKALGGPDKAKRIIKEKMSDKRASNLLENSLTVVPSKGR